ncbi:MAG TPA: hypothetical protein VHS33_03830 [Sphingomicrobium sp.]|jgi:APA family basic amino acid/polyamine antiporter|nr:hypothetical protein [Sphingomicrobium sp.]
MTTSSDSKMGIWMTSALVVGTIIGAAIFMLPVSLAPLGFNSLIGWLISGIGAVCIAYALAQFSRFGGEGIQANIEREFSPTVAFLVTWSFWVSDWVDRRPSPLQRDRRCHFSARNSGEPSSSRLLSEASSF